MPPSAGMRFSRFELVSRLGAGGMGDVWRAWDTDLHREVAVKFLPERFAADATRLGRFAQEARAASLRNHPNIVTIYEIGETSGLPYIVMELVEGQTLREMLVVQGGRPLPTRRLLDIATQTADGLAKAHAADIVHRDLKPENLMVTGDGFVKILDFGLAKLRGDGGKGGAGEVWFDSGQPTWPDSPSPNTAVGAVIGTAGYMSPEQARGQAVDFRSDQFTFGAILYELATGEQAFRRESPAQTMTAIIEEQPAPLGVRNPALPAPLRWVIERCLAKDPAERYASTLDLARELRGLRERLSGSDAASDAPAVDVRRGVGWARAARPAATVLLALAVVWGARTLLTGVWGTKASANRSLVVAVLPLTNLTGDTRYDATAAGIVQVVVDSLSQVDGLEVLPRAATIAFADRKSDIPAIARSLDASFVVDGMLQQSENKLRVSLSLVGASSNAVEWGETFDGAFPAVFDLQSRVANGVAHAARLRISPDERERIQARATASPSAWQDYATALALLDRQDRPGNAAAAIARLEEALRADPRFAAAHATLARACLARYEETGEALWADRGRDAAQEALRLDPRDVEVRRSLARILTSRGRFAEAIDELKPLVAQKPNSDGVRRLYSEVLINAGQPEAALDEARRAVEIRPSFAENQMSLGWANFSAGRFADAAGAYRRATEEQPDNGWAFQMLGTSLHAAGDLAGAVAPYREAIRLAPDARAWANLGFVYYATGRLPEAVHAYEEAVKLEPRSGTIRRDLGDVRARSGDRPAARADWTAAVELSREALQVNPKDTRQLSNVAICLAKLGQKDAAREAARRAIEAGPSSGDTHYAAAVVHALTGNAPEALDFLEKAFALGASVSLARDDDDLASLRARPEFKKLLERAATPPAKEVTRAS